MMYDVYFTHVKNEEFVWGRYRANVTREEALAALEKTKRMKNTVCKYHLVAKSREAEFIAKCEEIDAKVSAPRLAREARKAERWAQLDEMYKRGYRCTDVLAFLNS